MTEQELPEQLCVEVDLTKISLDEYFIKYCPVPIQSTYLWKYFSSIYESSHHHKHECCNCCCCNCCCTDMHHKHEDEEKHEGTTETPTTPPTPRTVAFDTFSASANSLVIGGGIIGAFATFDWRTSGDASRRVDIQVRSAHHGFSGSYPSWTTILSNQNPTDLETWNVRARPGERLHVRGRVHIPGTSIEDFSNVVTLG